MKSPTPWLWLIFALMAGFVLMSTWSFYRAAKGTSAVTDRDYYSHGLRYNQTLLERQAAASLGWQVVTQLDGRILTIRLHDRDQRGVTGATGTLTLLGAGPLSNQEFVLREIAAGSYQTELPVALHGQLSAEMAFHRDGARLSKRLLFALK
jgi:nitrogen fixation protein FixH